MLQLKRATLCYVQRCATILAMADLDIEFLEFVRVVLQITSKHKQMDRREIRDRMRFFYKESNRLLNDSCSARIPGGSAICTRPLNHSGPHTQSAITWEGPMF